VHRREVLVGQRGRPTPVGTHRSVGDLPDAKTREYEDLVANSLSMGIVQTIVVLIADSAGAYLRNHQCACGLSRMWAASLVGHAHCGPR
jgi:hypothetical protein